MTEQSIENVMLEVRKLERELEEHILEEEEDDDDTQIKYKEEDEQLNGLEKFIEIKHDGDMIANNENAQDETVISTHQSGIEANEITLKEKYITRDENHDDDDDDDKTDEQNTEEQTGSKWVFNENNESSVIEDEESWRDMISRGKLLLDNFWSGFRLDYSTLSNEQ